MNKLLKNRLIEIYTKFMSDTKMLQAIIDGQSAIKEELSDKIDRVNKKVDSLDNKVDEGFKRVNNKIDKIGSQLAYLANDTPTKQKFDKLTASA